MNSELVVKDIGGLVKDHQGKRQLDSSALEQIVASVEVSSYTANIQALSILI